MSNSTSRAPRSRRRDEATAQFVESLADLRHHASQVVKLGRKRIGMAFTELDDGTGDLPRRVLLLMDNIEESFQTIRHKFGE